MPRLLSLTVLLALSFVAHGVWATPPSGPGDTPAPAPGGAVSGVLTAPFAERLAAARTAADFRSVMAELRGAGVPESLVLLIVRAAVEDNVLRHRQADFDHAVGPYWREVNLAPGSTQAMREVQSLLAELGFPPSHLEQAVRRRQYGGLSEAKAAALEKLLHDQATRRRELYATPVDRRQGDEVTLLREEQQRAFDALLTPEERLEWDLRNSKTAEKVRQQVRSIDLTEPEFRALFAAQRTFEETTRAPDLQRPPWEVPRTGRVAPPGPVLPEQKELILAEAKARSAVLLELRERVLAAWDAHQAEMRRVLGDDRYREVALASARPAVAKILKTRPELTADQVIAVVRMEWSMSNDADRAENAPGLSPEEGRARATAVRQRYRDELVKLLGPDAADEIFRAPTHHHRH